MSRSTSILYSVCFLALFGLSACSSGTGSLILSPAGNSKSFSQKFWQSYGSHNEDGSYEFLFISDDADAKAHRAKPGRPLRPTVDFPLRQLVHVKIPWLPMRGNIAETIVSNASVQWYIYSDAPDHQQDLLLYSGAGFGLAQEHNDKFTLDLKSATLRPQIVRGTLTDPLGTFELSGTVTAANNPARLKEILAHAREQLGLGQ